MTAQAPKRIPWIDLAKGLAILLVVFGHTLRGGTAQKLVYSFHVAAFFFLSGMTCKSSLTKEQLWKDIRRIMVPYYAFGLLSILLFFFLGKFAAGKLSLDIDPSLSNNLLELLYACPKGNRIKFNMPLWFLPCLFVTKLLYYLLCSLFRQKPLPILLCSAGCAALGFLFTELGIHSLPFHLTVSLKMLLFFSLGRCFFLFLAQKKQRLQGWKPLLLGVGLLGITALAAWISPKVNYSGDTFPHIPAFLFTALGGTFGLCFLSMGLGRCKPLEYIGTSTLAILVMHKFPILLFQTAGPLKEYLNQYDSLAGIATAGAIAILSVVLCLVAQWVIRRYFSFLLGQ